jgi:hypothetical protein
VLRVYKYLLARAAVVLAVCGIGLAGVATASAQQVTQDGNATVIAAIDEFGGLDFYWQPIGGSQSFPSSFESVAPAGTLPHGSFQLEPSIAVAGDETVIAAQGANNNLVVYEQPIYAVRAGSGGNGCCSGPWHADPNPFAGDGTTFSEPSIAALGNNTILITAQGQDNSLQFYWQTVGTTTWHAIQAAPEYSVANGAPQLAVVGGNPVIAAEGDGNSHIDFWHENWRTSTWSSSPQWVGNALGGPSSIAAIGNGVAIVATVWNVDSKPTFPDIGYFTEASGSSTWTTQTLFPPTLSSEASVWANDGPPSLAEVGGSAVITDVGDDYVAAYADGCNYTDSLYFWWEPVGGSSWSPPQIAACHAGSGAMASVAQVGSAAVIFDPDQNGGDFYWEGIGSSTWSQPQSIPGP